MMEVKLNHLTIKQAIHIMSKNIAAKVIWFSPRKFSNEGTFYYGTTETVDRIIDEYDPFVSLHNTEGEFETVEEAKKFAERECNKANRSSPHFEECYVFSAPAEDYFNPPAW